MGRRLQDFFFGVVYVSVILYTEHIVKGILSSDQIWPFGGGSFDDDSTPRKANRHLLFISFKLPVSPTMINVIRRRTIAFREICLKPDGKPYILSGRIAHGFVIEFTNPSDCWYFLHMDQAYKNFVESIDPTVDDFLTVAFSPGLGPGWLRLQY
ncbi:predicted protein [Chaetomium globosum CBS 148.51]|uniref:Stress-response A/B barrel domain-containing protein n=1 Tax=Chaetomium globosum (strain ATCC 6205 / CBS 148.51 / DSM 1962 / NBRC 6347 / NRRL 1970) TaxID=306901 RepID=Q2GTD6_CHAGB|nr:uncharacterized protein CHGG_08768 [Chaetomium globosum CBS 148.51]EAQ84754.1 predicted protein [Chaetomium globosum CBS 148.51]